MTDSTRTIDLQPVRELVVAAGEKWLKATADLGPVPRNITDVLLMSAAWLDFYDEVWPVIEEILGKRFFEPSGRDELQRMLRAMAKEENSTRGGT